MINAVRTRLRHDQSGFTLIELLIVITILGILAAVVVFSVGGIDDRGNKSACASDYKTLQTAQEAYRLKTGAYAPDTTALTVAPNRMLSSVSKLWETDATGVIKERTGTPPPGFSDNCKISDL